MSYKLGLDQYTDRRNNAFDINPGRSLGSVSQSARENRDLNSDLLLTLSPQISDDFGLSVTLGQNVFDSRFVNQFSQGTTLAVSDFYHISNAADVTTGEDFSRKRIIAAFGTADLSYSDYLFLNLTGRNDWSSTLPAIASCNMVN